MSIPKHIIVDVDLDWVTFYCPCGSSFCNRYDRDRSETDKWRKVHYQHSDGYIEEHITDRGATVMTKDSPRHYRKKID